MNYEKLREDLEDNAYGEFFAGGIGAGLVEVGTIESADDKELEEIAKGMGVDLKDYED